MNRTAIKSWLRSQIGVKYSSTTYEITVDKVADKRVSFIESINGIQHQHNRYAIEEAYNYLQYKISLNKRLSEQRGEIDTKFTSTEYKNQKSSYDDVVAEITELFDEEIFYDIDSKKYSIIFESENDIKIEFVKSGHIAIRIRNGVDWNFIELVQPDTSTRILPIDVNDSCIFEVYGRLLTQNKLTIADLGADAMNELLVRYRDTRTQLNKFTVTSSTDIEFPLEQNEIINFVSLAKIGESLVIPLTDNDNRKRALYIERTNRVSYLIEVRNFRECETTGKDIMQAEYWLKKGKFSANYTESVKILAKIYDALS